MNYLLELEILINYSTGYHWNCTSCKIELDSTAREIKSRTGFAANDMVILSS